MNKNNFEIEIVIYVEPQSDPLEVTISGEDLQELKSDILPTIIQICNNDGYANGKVYFEITISKNGEWYDSDDGALDLATDECSM